MLKVKIINKSKHPLPRYATPQSAGMDLRANIEEPITMSPLERRLYKQFEDFINLRYSYPLPADRPHRHSGEVF